MDLLDLGVTAAGLTALALGVARWLRVSQREGWAPFSATAWAVRWWTLPENAAVAAVAVLSLAISPVVRLAALVVAVAVATGPFGLHLRGRRPGGLVWTRRCRRVVIGVALAALTAVGAGLIIGPATAAVAAGFLAVISPLLVDLASVAAGGPDPREGTVPSDTPADEVLAELDAASRENRRVLVTGGPSGAAGRAVAASAVARATHLLIVGRHGRADLQRGAAEGPPGCQIVLCPHVEDAEAWVQAHAGPADTVRWLAIPADHVP